MGVWFVLLWGSSIIAAIWLFGRGLIASLKEHDDFMRELEGK